MLMELRVIWEGMGFTVELDWPDAKQQATLLPVGLHAIVVQKEFYCRLHIQI